MLANKPILSILILVITNLAFVLSTTFLSLLIPSISHFYNQIIQIIMVFISWCVLVFLLVPFGYKLPKKNDSFKSFLKDINLTNFASTQRIVVYTIGCYVIFLSSELIGSLIYGQFYFDISRILPPNSYYLLNINSGLFEEIMFRGIIFTLLLNIYSKKKSLIVSAFVFGIVHYANLLNGISYENFIFTTAQVIWAVGMGILWGYLVLKTNSIIPGIILHYLSNSLDALWFFVPASSIEIYLLYKLLFAKFIPIILSILLIRYLSNARSLKLKSNLSIKSHSLLF